MRPYKFVDLFAGAGGFSLGFESAGAKPILAIERDAWACDTFRHNHPQVPVLCADVTQLDSADAVRAAAGAATFVIGGPPCQGFSIANRNGGDPKDPRNSLFMDFLRIAQAFEPSIIVIENVPNLVRARTESGQLVLDVIRHQVEKLGYHFYSSVLLASDFGVPQMRRRLFCIGSREPLASPFPLATHFLDTDSGDLLRATAQLQRSPTLWDAISDLPELEAREGAEELEYLGPALNSYQELMRVGSSKLYNHKAMNHSKRMVERFRAMKCGESGNDVPHHLKPRKRNSAEISSVAYDQNNRRMYPDLPCHTIPASFYANFVHPFQHRNFTAREGARIQSFPDAYRFLGKPTVVSHKLLGREERTDELFLCQYNQIGNAVPPLLAQAVASNLISQL